MRNMLMLGTIIVFMVTSLIVGGSRVRADVERVDGERMQTALVAQSEIVKDTLQAQTPTQTQTPPDAQATARSTSAQTQTASSLFATGVPHKGSVQVLNGCGIEGAGKRVADFLRSKNFDVKDIGNAPTWNYPATMIVSRTADMTLANEIEHYMKSGKVVVVRNAEQLYDVTVIIGPDFEERIK